MPLDGLRAWIGEVERKLGMRTRVFLVLTVIAIGAAGAGIYLAVDARDSAVSEGDVQALQEQLEARIEQLSGNAGNGQSAGSGSTGTGGGSSEGTSGGATGEGPGGAQLGELLEQAKKQNEQAEREQAGK